MYPANHGSRRTLRPIWKAELLALETGLEDGLFYKHMEDVVLRFYGEYTWDCSNSLLQTRARAAQLRGLRVCSSKPDGIFYTYAVGMLAGRIRSALRREEN